MDFIERIAPYVIKYMEQEGILASLTLAQAIVESDWGRSELAVKANNLFGIKANSTWTGDVYHKETREFINGKWIIDTAAFCKFSSIEECIAYRSKVFLKRSHYKSLWGVTNYKIAARIIWEAGYATDPNYPQKLIDVIEKYQLYKYDKVVSNLKIVIDAGHGYNTSGKRTPDGSMREWEFNSAVANYVKENLDNYENVGIYFAHDPSGKADIPLKDRTDFANRIDADVYVSIHANAYGNGWNDAKGIETYVHTTNPVIARNLANIVQKKLVEKTGLFNRGVKTANFHVLRETKMTAILVECGFMTNKEEAALLKSDVYRKKCAQAIAEGLVEFYKLKLKQGRKVSGMKPDWVEWQWKEAEETYRKAREKGIITSDMWEKKAAAKELTFDDITFLNLVLNGRSGSTSSFWTQKD